MLDSKFVRNSFPGPAYTHHRAGIIRFTRACFKPGMWQEMSFPACGGYAEIQTSHMQPIGLMVDPLDVLAPREAGWMSSEDHTPIPEGVHRRLAVTDVEVWCARPWDGVSSVAHVHQRRLMLGDTVTMVPGDCALLVNGSVACDGEELAAPKHVVVSSDEKVLVAASVGYLFLWRPDEAV